MMSFDYVVVGTGPSGFSLLKELVKSEKKILVLDAGEDFKPKKVSIEEYYEALFSKSSPLKPSHGHRDFYTKPNDELDERIQSYASRVVGGFSVVWGRSFLPLMQDSKKILPQVPEGDMLPWIEKVEKETLRHISFGPEMKRLLPLTDMEEAVYSRLKNGLSSNYHIVPTAIALNKHPDPTKCFQCGHCIVGCPENYLYSTEDEFKDLLNKSQNLTFIPRTKVESFETKENKVFLKGIRDGQAVSFEAERVFFATGVYATLQIFSRSLDFKARIHDSAYLIAPGFFFGKVSQGISNIAYSLSFLQVFARMKGVSKEGIAVQIYRPHQLFARLLLKKMGPWNTKSWAIWFANKLASRILLLQVFFDSNESPSVKVDVLNGKMISKISRPQGWLFRKFLVQFRIFFDFLSSGVFVPPFVWMQTKIGSSFHTGAMFPGSKQAGLHSHASNEWGEIENFPGVHVVDASIFQSIPPGSLTLTLMANARRIGAHFSCPQSKSGDIY